MKRSCLVLLCLTLVLASTNPTFGGQRSIMVSEVSTRLENVKAAPPGVAVYQHGDCRHYGDIAIADVLAAVNMLADRLEKGETVTLIRNYRVYPEHVLREHEKRFREYFGVTVCPSGRNTDYCLGKTFTFFFRFVDGQIEMSDIVEAVQS